MDISRIPLDRRYVTWPLALAATLLVATNMAMQTYRLITHHEHVTGLPMMNLDGEHNLPSLFSTLLLLGASLFLTVIAILERNQRTRDASKWMILAAGFFLMTMDESLSLHEHLIDPMRNMLGGGHLGIFFFAWVIPGLALVAILGVFFLPFMLRLPRRTAIAFAISAAIYLGGALGVELIEGWWRESHSHRNLAYHALVSLEEGMEMAGVIVFIHALLGYIASRYAEVRFVFDDARAAATDETEAQSPARQPLVGGQPTLAPSASE